MESVSSLEPLATTTVEGEELDEARLFDRWMTSPE